MQINRSSGALWPTGIPEQGAILDGEAPKLPKAVLRGDFGHRCRAGSALAQRPPRHMHAAEQQIMLWADAQMLLATHPQSPFRNPDRLTDLRDKERPFRVLL